MSHLFKNKKNKKNILDVTNNQFVEVEIKENCTIEEYEDALNSIEKMNIPNTLLLTEEKNMFKTKLAEQKIIVINFSSRKIIIVSGNNEVRISETIYSNDEFIDENLVTITNDKVMVTKYIRDLNYNTKFCKCYPNDNPAIQNWTLDKDEAIGICKSIIHFVSHIININETLDVQRIKYNVQNMEKTKQIRLI